MPQLWVSFPQSGFDFNNEEDFFLQDKNEGEVGESIFEYVLYINLDRKLQKKIDRTTRIRLLSLWTNSNKTQQISFLFIATIRNTARRFVHFLADCAE